MSKSTPGAGSLRSAAVLIAAAVLLRALTRVIDAPLPDRLFTFVRTFLYLALFAAWGASVRQRVLHTPVRRMLIAVSALTILWLAVREIKFRFTLDPDLTRALWYAYYIPILLIPYLALCVSERVGRPETESPSAWIRAAGAVTAAGILSVLTNDLHSLVFVFPPDAAVRSEADYRYGIVYYLVLAWAVFCAATALGVMFVKSRVPQTRRFLWLPLLPFGVSFVYIALYALPEFRWWLGDVAVFFCLVFLSFFELCIQCSLIPSNTRYLDLFRASVGIPMTITDEEYAVRYRGGAAVPFPPERMRQAETAPVTTPEGVRLHSTPVRGGRAVWTEDISALLSLHETLSDRQEELQERQALLRHEYEQEKEHRIVEEQNRLYDLLQSKTQRQLEGIRALSAAYRGADAARRKTILSRIVVLGSFIKRRRDFVLSLDSAPVLPPARLESALAESYRALSLLAVRGGYYVDAGRDYLPGETLTRAYDFFEDVLEAVWDTARYLSVRVCPVGGVLRIHILTDGAPADGSLSRRYPAMRCAREDDGTEFLLPLEGGDAA